MPISRKCYLQSTGGVGSLKGNRLGFDLGGSDRKCAAMVDGEVIFSEEIKWSPYFESDPAYHRAGIEDSLKRAAAHLPTVDAIGGSSAGIFINNEPRVSSLFRGISQEDFEKSIRNLFHALKTEWNDIPFEMANDGDVTAMAGAMAIDDSAVLGSLDGDQPRRRLHPPQGFSHRVDQRARVRACGLPRGCRHQMNGAATMVAAFNTSRNKALAALLPLSGIEVSEGLGLPEKLEVVQEKMAQGDERAAAIYRTIGTCFGYTIAHFAEFYEFRHLLIPRSRQLRSRWRNHHGRSPPRAGA